MIRNNGSSVLRCMHYVFKAPHSGSSVVKVTSVLCICATASFFRSYFALRSIAWCSTTRPHTCVHISIHVLNCICQMWENGIHSRKKRQLHAAFLFSSPALLVVDNGINDTVRRGLPSVRRVPSDRRGGAVVGARWPFCSTLRVGVTRRTGLSGQAGYHVSGLFLWHQNNVLVVKMFPSHSTVVTSVLHNTHNIDPT